MTELNPEVLERIREELKKRPKLGSGVLHEMAQWIDPSLGALTLRAFQARYVFPIRYELGIGVRKTRRQRKPRTKRQRQPVAAQGKRSAKAAPPEEVATPAEAGAAAEAPPPGKVPPRTEVPSPTEAVPPAELPLPAESPPLRDGATQRPAQAADRDRIRAVFLEVARDFAAAESTADIVRVFSRLEEYVDRVVGERN